MTNWLRRFTAMVALVAGMLIVVQNNYSADFGAKVSNGPWTAPSSWNANGVPVSTDDVYVGSDSRIAGSAISATINLTQNQSAQNVFLGYGNGTSGTLQLGNFNLTVNYLLVGADGNGVGIVNRGTGGLVVGNTLFVNNTNFTFAANDTATILSLTNATGTTTATGNIKDLASLSSRSTLNLNSNLNLARYAYVSDSTINAQGHNITTTESINLANATAVIANRGSLNTNRLSVNNQSFNLNSSDRIDTFELINGTTALVSGIAINSLILDSSTGTTASVGNITSSVTLKNASTLNLTSDLNLTNNVYVSSGTVNMQNRNISAPAGIILYSSTSHLTNRGNLNTSILYVDGQIFDIRTTDSIGTLSLVNGATTTLPVSSAVSALSANNVSTATVRTATVGSLTIANGSTITVKSGQPTGLNLTDSTAGAIYVDATSKLRLEVDGAVNGWVLRWANPAGGNHIADLNTLISAGKIDFTLTNGGHYFVTSNADGFTYVLQPVPEPATTMLIAVGGLASGWVIRRRRLASAVVV